MVMLSSQILKWFLLFAGKNVSALFIDIIMCLFTISYRIMTLYANSEKPLILSVPVYTFLKSKILYHQNTSLKPALFWSLLPVLLKTLI